VLTVTGPQTVTAGSTNQYIARITGGPAVVGGVDIAVTSGTLDTILGQGTRLLRREIVQSNPKAFAAGAVSFAFKWTAPSTAGSVSMFGAAVSGNGNNIETGDAGDGATTNAITVQPANIPPIASFTYTCTPARACTFTSTSTDPDGTVVAWLWTTPSGARTLSTAASFAHTFPASKTLSLKLTVTDNGGATASVTQQVVVP
jgi:PKD repeat protein